MATPTTVNTWPLNGSIQEFDVTFDYLAQTFIKVNLVGPTGLTLLTLGTDYTFVTPTRIRTTLVYGPPNFTTIELRRETSTTERLVEFQDASILHATDLNTDALQVMHVAEEARNAATETLGVNGDGNLDARNRRIVNVLDPVDPADVVTLNYYTSQVNGVHTDRLAAEAARDKAQEWAIKPTAVEGTDQSAKTYAGQAASSASAAAGSASSASTSASNASGSASAAAGSASSASTSAGNASSSASAAAGSASAASTSAGTATAQAGIATTQAGIATTKAAEAAASALSVDAAYLNGQLANNTVAQSLHGGQLAGTRNAIINGAMMISHEGDQVGTVAGAYGVDMWATIVNPPGTHVTNGGRIDINGSPLNTVGLYDAHRLRRSTTAAIGTSDYIALQYSMEGNDMRRFIGNTFTFSFWVRANKTGPLIVAFRSGAANRSYYQTVNIAAANTWQKAIITVSGGLPTDWANNETITGWRDRLGLQICFVASTGNTFRNGTNGTWYTGNFLGPTGSTNLLTTAGDFFDVTGVQMELGSVATAFEQERYNATIVRLNRYVYFADSVQLASVGSPNFGGGFTYVPFPTRMCKPPTAVVTLQAGNAGGGIASNISFSSCHLQFAAGGQPATSYGIYTMFFRAYPSY